MAITREDPIDYPDRTVTRIVETDEQGRVIGVNEEVTWKPGSDGANQQENQTSLDSLRATLLALVQGTQTATQADLNTDLARFVLLLDAAYRGDTSTVI